ncbi:TolC family protein [Methylocystis parvus]|uniref:TolC family protein n=1 Tax=Methylocystis parvus TaxID=134 RepID=UPI003C748555
MTGTSLKSTAFPKIAPGLPSEVLLRRPDVAEAEAQLASQEFSVLQARAAFFPSISFHGQYGVQSIVCQISGDAGGDRLADAGQDIAQPIFDGYNLQGQYMLQQGKYSELAANYRKQTLTPLRTRRTR